MWGGGGREEALHETGKPQAVGCSKCMRGKGEAKAGAVQQPVKVHKESPLFSAGRKMRRHKGLE